MLAVIIFIFSLGFILLTTITAPPFPSFSEGWLGYIAFGLFLIVTIAGLIQVLINHSNESEESDVLIKLHSGEHVTKSANGALILSGNSVRRALNGLARKCLIDFSETDSGVVVSITALGRKKLKSTC